MATPNPILAKVAAHALLLIPTCSYCDNVYDLFRALDAPEPRFAGLSHGMCHDCRKDPTAAYEAWLAKQPQEVK